MRMMNKFLWVVASGVLLCNVVYANTWVSSFEIIKGYVKNTLTPPVVVAPENKIAPISSEKSTQASPIVAEKKIAITPLPQTPRVTPAMLAQHPPKTELSKKALNLKIGMTREAVLNLLGTPTWGMSYAGMPLDWTWKNGNCNPVDVTFDESLHVNGFNEGRATCLETEYQDLPDDEHLCANPASQIFCGLWFKYQKESKLTTVLLSHHIFVMSNRNRKNH